MPWFIGGFIVLRFLVIAFFVLLAVRIVAGLRHRHDGALEVASRRFASGEMSEEQFRRMREVLNSGDSA
ncbi:MAG TPA: hypothetical protein VL354_18540 [Spirochaetia bacterium]|nr:hypothetical protein [Spirochaetia bacterium]